MQMRMSLVIHMIGGIRNRQVQQFSDFTQVVKISIDRTFTDRGMLLMNMQIYFFRGWMISKGLYGVQHQFSLYRVSDVTHAILLNENCF